MAALDGVIQLAQTNHYDAAHAHHVARLATALFDDLEVEHGLGDDERFDLYAAALLHDIGQIAGRPRHHKRSCRIIMESTLLTEDFFTPTRRLRIGCVARYHRKAQPGSHHRRFMSLERKDRRVVRVLASILRTADALDKGHEQVVTDLCCALTDRTLLIDCAVTNRARVRDLIEPVRKVDLMSRIFGRRIHFAWHEA